MKNILKIYFVGAVIIYPAMLWWAFKDVWKNETDLYNVIMEIYGILLLPVLGIYFNLKSKKLLSTIFFILFAFYIIQRILFLLLTF